MNALQLRKVISGGQTGADRAALEAAKSVRLETGGVAPLNFLTSTGPDRTLQTQFQMTQLPLSPGDKAPTVAQMYVRRSQLNVDSSDATVAFRMCASVGTDKTIGYARTRKWQVGGVAPSPPYRPCLVIDDVKDMRAAAEKIVAFISQHDPVTLNVCGHRSDESAKLAGFSSAVQLVTQAALEVICLRKALSYSLILKEEEIYARFEKAI